TYVSLAACLVGLLLAAMTFAISSAPGMRGSRYFSLACFWGAAYAAANATVATTSFELSRVGVRFGLFCIGFHGSSWFVYAARREGRRLFIYERAIVTGCVVWSVLSLVPNLLYRSDERWLHG
ncbi:hypothetical protein G6O45_30020, partial [Salmonella enterica subsp. enterica serovar Istanbul]|nr:hypothetical protein [Salmonella enterica subsp. enterica serovar Istanbul]